MRKFSATKKATADGSAADDAANGVEKGGRRRRVQRPKAPLSERATLTVEETARYLGIGRQTAYDEVRCGRLPVIRAGRLGKRILVVRALLDEMIQLRAREGWRYGAEETVIGDKRSNVTTDTAKSRD